MTPTTSTWTGAVSGSWLDSGNWDVAPANGNDLVFPTTAAHLADSTNDLTDVNSFASVTIEAGGYTIGGNAITVTGAIAASQESGASEIDLPLTLTAASPTVTVDNGGASLVLGGVIGGTSLTKSGDGELDLTQANTYTGTTAVNGGTLVVNGAQGQSAVTLAAGTTLAGTGTVGGITTTGATVNPGQGAPGILTDSGNLNLDPDSHFAVALNGGTAGTGYSQLSVAGTVDLAGATLDTTVGFTPTANEQFIILDNTGSSPVTGTFDGLAEGATFTDSGSGQIFRISYVGGTGNDVVLTQLVGTTTAVTAVPSPSVFGQSVTLTATVTPASGSATPTGTVQFFAGATSLGIATLAGDGVATLDTTAIPVGAANQITAQYQGDSSFAGSTSPAASVEVDQANTTTVVVAAPTSSVFGQSVTLTATVSTASPGAGTPTGTVEFFVGGTTSLGTGTVNGSGVATLATTAIPLGASNQITAQYQGDTNFNGSTTTTAASVAVAQASTTTTVVAAPSPGGLGQPVTLTATVSAASPGAGTPTGTVEFFVGGTTSLGTGTLSGGVASVTTTTLPLGDNTITATYSGDADFVGGTSDPITETILKATATTLLIDPTSSVFGQSVSLTATVTAVTGAPTGTVEFFAGATSLGTATLDGFGMATLDTTAIPVGAANTITVTYEGDSTFAGSTSAAETIAVSQANTTTVVVAAPTSSVFGQSVTLTATVSAASPGAGTPTGTVEFFVGGTTSLGTGTVNGSGVATLATTAIPLGASNQITAQYQGDTNFNGSTTTTAASVAVAQASTTTTVVAAPSPGGLGQPVTLTATVAAVSPGSGTPTGTVQFFAGATSLGTGTLSGGVASITTSTLPLGDNTITATYSGDADFVGGTSDPITETILDASTTTMVAAPTSSTYGESVTLTATVVAATGTGTPTGVVVFFAGGASLGTGTVNGSGVATLDTTAIPAGASNQITARYAGDQTFAASTSPVVPFDVAQASTTTTLSASPSSTVFGQSVTLTATVGPVSPGGGIPTGTVQFFAGATSLGTGTLDSTGIATLATTAIPLGAANAITAVYNSDGNYATSTSAPSTVTVSQASTTTVVTAAPNPVGVNQTLTLTATVSAVSPGSGTPTGTVQFFAGATSLGTGTLSGGVASVTTTFTALGSQSITAVYAGDTNFTTSTSTAITVPVLNSSTTTVVAAPTSTVFGQSVTLTATAAASSGTGTPTGSVQFFVGTTSLGTGTLDSTGVATLATTAIPVGASNMITAQYLGDSSFAGSTSSATAVTVSQAGTTTVVTAAPNPSSLGDSVTLTSTVAATSPGSGTPTGTVEFFANGTSLGTGTLSGGVATLTTTTLASGANSITAQYQGDTNFTSSTSAAITLNVGLAVTTSTVTVSPNPSAIGGTVTFTATVSASAINGTPTGMVAFYVGNNLLGTSTLDSNGVATISTSSLPVGNSAITAVYGGDSTHATSTSAAATASVGTDNQIFINQIYLDVMGRPADAKGLAYWSGLLNRGISRKVVVNGLVRSPEAVTQTVQSIFGNLLGTSATRAELRAALSMKNPSALNITAAVLGSRTFFRSQGGGTIAGYLGALGDVVLGAPLPTGATSFFTSELSRGVPATKVAQQLLASSIGREATVETLYTIYLGRDVDRTGQSFYTRLLDNGFTPGQVTVDILNSTEYYDLALSQILGSSDDSSDSTN